MVDFTISDPGNSFLSQLKPTAIIINQSTSWITYITPAVSLLCASVGIWATWKIAGKARELANQQKNIAQSKLETDTFGLRFDVYNCYCSFYSNLITKDYSSIGECWADFNSFTEMHRKSLFLFPNEYHKIFDDLYNSLNNLHTIRLNTLDSKNLDHNTENFSSNKTLFQISLKKLQKLMEEYMPDILRYPLKSKTSDPEPQPTGPKAILMRLTRGVCEWSRPLQ
ncbi:hypothetical protein [Acetobacter orientalis]|uniref:hypothetical protein n=1 Tax=Acetobacter orientalis TaxID=146474 RepID=UPI0039EA257B